MEELIEEWREVNGYKISNYGIILGRKGSPLKFSKNKGGYVVCDLDFGYPYGRVRSVHRAVALVFIPNPENKSDVNHKDADKTNNRVNNLEWNTRQENMTHSSINRLHPKTAVPCIIDKEGKIIKIYYSMSDLSRECGALPLQIFGCFIGKQDGYFGQRIRKYDLDKQDYIRTKFDDPNYEYKSTRRRRIRCIENGEIYKTQSDASRKLNINQGLISDYLTGKRKENIQGYTFEYFED